MLKTINEMAQIAGVSATQVRNWIRLHAMPTVKIGRRILIRQDQFDDWLKSKEVLLRIPPVVVLPEIPALMRSKVANKMRQIN